MKLLSDAEAARWCAMLGLEVQADGGTPRIRFAAGGSSHLRISVPVHARDLLTFAYVALMSAIATDDELDFQGALLWLTDWDIWSATTERVGLELLKELRAEDLLKGDLRSAPAHLLAADEIIRAQSLLLLPLLFLWDAFYVPPAGGLLCAVSHHGFVDIHARDASTLARLRERFARAGYTGDESRPS